MNVETDPLAAAREAVLTLPGVVITTVEADIALQEALKVYEERAQLVGQAAIPCYCSWYEESDALNCDEHDDGPCPSCDARRRLSELAAGAVQDTEKPPNTTPRASDG